MWFNEERDSPLLFDTLLNYFKDKFKLNEEGEGDELMEIVRDFCADH